ncbi:hypothetical protein F5B21DRAFT_523666 [Xylaria acuta]|nr:hypothetical protein F5B21DRAFT_523666 [Xylaria acuta]
MSIIIVNVSDALRNLILDHAPNSDTFQKHYLSRNVCVDLWAVHMDRMPQQALLQEAISHGSSRSSCRPTYLTAERSESRTPLYTKIRSELHAAKKKVARDLLATIRWEWTENQAVEDIELQVQGTGFAPHEDNRLKRPMGFDHESLVEALTISLICDLLTQRQRRMASISAIVTYRSIEEPMPTGVVGLTQPPVPVEVQEEKPMESLKQSVYVKSPDENLLRCFICAGKALFLLMADDPKMSGYCRNFYSPNDLTKHFRRQHLSKLRPDDRSYCPSVLASL